MYTKHGVWDSKKELIKVSSFQGVLIRGVLIRKYVLIRGVLIRGVLIMCPD